MRVSRFTNSCFFLVLSVLHERGVQAIPDTPVYLDLLECTKKRV